jgi:hypothetical protein
MRNRFCECSRAWRIALVMLADLYPWLDVVFMAFSVQWISGCISFLTVRSHKQRTEVTPLSDH